MVWQQFGLPLRGSPAPRRPLLTKKSGNVLPVGIFLDFVRLATRTLHEARTCGEPNELELTAIGVKLNGPSLTPRHRPARRPERPHGLLTKESGSISRVGIFLDFVWLTTRTPHGGVTHRTRGEPNEIELLPIGVELNGA